MAEEQVVGGNEGEYQKKKKGIFDMFFDKSEAKQHNQSEDKVVGWIEERIPGTTKYQQKKLSDSIAFEQKERRELNILREQAGSAKRRIGLLEERKGYMGTIEKEKTLRAKVYPETPTFLSKKNLSRGFYNLSEGIFSSTTSPVSTNKKKKSRSTGSIGITPYTPKTRLPYFGSSQLEDVVFAFPKQRGTSSSRRKKK